MVSATVPTQALTLFNGDFAMRQSRHFADRLMREAQSFDGQVKLAWRLAFSRPPNDNELRTMRAFHEQQLQEFQQSGDSDVSDLQTREALTQLCRVIFNLNEL